VKKITNEKKNFLSSNEGSLPKSVLLNGSSKKASKVTATYQF
jgi:hypothetical protein